MLLAEDNEINALLARSLLTRLGHSPVVRHERQQRYRLLRGGARGGHAV